MEIKNNISLKAFNTFGIDVSAERFMTINQDEEIIEFLTSEYAKEPFFVLGEGSNILLTKDIHGTILKMETKGIDILSLDRNKVQIKAKAGEDWDEFVWYCLENNYNGLENLALIPGKVGSSPIQNIGAYGEEVKNHIKRVYTISVKDGSKRIFENSACEFGYRSSVFKTIYKNQYIITDVEFELSIDGKPNLCYADIAKRLENTAQPTAKDIYDTVSEIRTEKLPDYKKLGNAGSFFKNPVINIFHYESIKQKYLDLKAYPVSLETCKLSAAQLIDLAGWKGKRIGNVGVHEKQPLVLVNYGGATGNEILSLATKIQQDIFSLFGIKLDMEVNVL
jgi:UDP-N-acetylmuramate dehydrogenase